MSMWIFFEPGEKASSAAGDAVVEAGADRDHDVAVVHGVVGLVGAVHAEHAEPLRVGGREGAEAHQGRGDRAAGQLGELAQQRRGRGAGIDDAAAGVEHRPLGLGDQLDRGGGSPRVALGARPVALVLDVGSGRCRCPCANWTSLGMSTSTGPGRPALAT